MKAYVIKNKEGKYLRGKFDKKGNILFTDDIIDAMFYEEDGWKTLEYPKDCPIVPITIAEGDLEQQLAEKDEQIEYLREQNIYKVYLKNEECLGVYPKNMEKIIRHQVCEEISKKLADRAELIDTGHEATFMFDLYDLEQCIKEVEKPDEIEKGEDK